MNRSASFWPLPYDVQFIIEAALSWTLRISEVFGIQERHLDFTLKAVRIEQRFYRGDLDITKTGISNRLVPMAQLEPKLRERLSGDPEAFVFYVRTHTGREEKSRICRDDRDINQHFLRPAAKKLGFYYSGFGFHALRRQAKTVLGTYMDAFQVMRLAGHSKADMSLMYTLEDLREQERAIRAWQERILGEVKGPPI